MANITRPFHEYTYFKNPYFDPSHVSVASFCLISEGGIRCPPPPLRNFPIFYPYRHMVNCHFVKMKDSLNHNSIELQTIFKTNKMELLQSQAPVDRELSGSSASARHGTSDIGDQTSDIGHGTQDTGHRNQEILKRSFLRGDKKS